jgi:trans-aconitate methyltransferase
MDPKYGERYRDLFERHWWWRARSKYILDLLRRIEPRARWKTILDIGCGDGLFFPELSRFAQVEGVEPFEDLVNPSNPYRSQISICPFDEHYRPGKQYSLVLMLDVLEHIEDAIGALRHAISLLEPDGKIVLTVPAFMALWTNHDVMNHHFVRYTKASFRLVAQHAGLEIQGEQYLYHWTCPVKLGVRVMEQLFHQQPKPAAVPAPTINESLFWLSRMEQKILTPLSLPFGSSLLVVGAKRKDRKA